MKIAVLNAGSSSLKFKLFDMESLKVLRSALIENIGEENSIITNHKEAIESLDIDFSSLDVIGHRVVHGGEKFQSAAPITQEVIKEITKLIPLAPLHNRANLEGIKVAFNKAPSVKQVAVFDTAFHSTMQKEAYLYALPYEMYERDGIRRYGFHGSSHGYIAKRAAKELNKSLDSVNLITLHLGNGASVCAIQNGKSIDTSMGFTPLEGLVMGSRSGDIDPAIVLYMQRELLLSVDEVDDILNKKSGLKGICESNDVREIIANDDEQSKLALTMMIRRIQKYIGAYMSLLDDVDAIVFSGGIGENSAYIREEVLKPKLFSNIKSLVIKTDEELEIASECLKVLKISEGISPAL
ncbi:acetate/propionate family kinase [Sulfurimonas aquatica]|uniref:Acetate kinase n=1 Tax=Sulfurimonas aquatica TaxID=2672570 RepID=A0A975AZ78_9BACT|nr:acetate kinase [Sulfurimonas aquatica]QSZ41190.1 acetate/propionate family kinase [Sulfurimonas aquatica]